MSIPAKVMNFLKKHNIKVQVVPHKKVYTTYDLANTLKTKLTAVAKTIIVKVDKGHVMLVLPASHQVDFKILKKVLGAKRVEIDRENVMVKLFNVKAGALSAFHGPLYKLPVYIDKAVMRAKKVVAQAGSFEQSVHITAKDLLNAVEGTLVNFAKKKK